MSKKGPLKLRELKKRLKPYGVIVIEKRGKGSELIFLLPNSPGSKQGPQYPIKNHGKGTEISWQVIGALLRRFNITDFWD
ncbi:MAG: type II toxin-antitoxin system HicA family toxin [Desulfobacterales bacterium]|uniref:Type II toxin-antitoxin system HicA family toxin n=1 Tax=Candidatus Desulfatibia vada TaxID=2841696 RepID=A0A8J6NQM0_9BACT|nr:type II toxin-antitoxin system HicA family toxin [Candidatus Desulfatibia vada]